jgi:hypothetical protein
VEGEREDAQREPLRGYGIWRLQGDHGELALCEVVDAIAAVEHLVEKVYGYSGQTQFLTSGRANKTLSEHLKEFLSCHPPVLHQTTQPKARKDTPI